MKLKLSTRRDTRLNVHTRNGICVSMATTTGETETHHEGWVGIVVMVPTQYTCRGVICPGGMGAIRHEGGGGGGTCNGIHPCKRGGVFLMHIGMAVIQYGMEVGIITMHNLWFSKN